ncbi:MAG: L-seryl-tRNA(Sec) selenium transferase [Desulfobacterales bacterium]|nr:L-seryl-tRNA(Sec) selenium transferase [Desulfobacterales bacterium]
MKAAPVPPDDLQKKRLRELPAVDEMLAAARSDPAFARVPAAVLVASIRAAIEAERRRILANDGGARAPGPADGPLMERAKQAVRQAMMPNLRRVVNATGVVIHTNLGRSLLAEEAVERMLAVAGRYSNLEYDLAAGRRGSRYSAVRDLLCEITGAEDAMVVNNNAGAVLISLETIARGRSVVVSRGDLVEIGGSFRIPDVMAKSGAILKEVGTTNRTHLRDYEDAIDPQTALLLKVHWSNYSIIGFTAQVPLAELAALGSRHGVPVMEDLGSGTFVDFSKYGLRKEPTVQESVAGGADVVTFSGDKLLGGPQAGIIVGRTAMVERIRKNPINRALRIDKLTLAALEGTLRLYRDEPRALTAIPTLRMLTATEESLAARARDLTRLLAALADARLSTDTVQLSSKAGGGSLPLLELPSRCLKLRIAGMSANALEAKLRRNDPPVIGRIEDDAFVMDMRTVQEDELAIIAAAISSVLGAT